MDMEEGVVSEVMKSPLREVFDHQQLITDVSGSGNNWSVFLIVTCESVFVGNDRRWFGKREQHGAHKWKRDSPWPFSMLHSHYECLDMFRPTL